MQVCGGKPPTATQPVCCRPLCEKNHRAAMGCPTDLRRAGQYEATTETGRGFAFSNSRWEQGPETKKVWRGWRNLNPSTLDTNQRGLPPKTGPHWVEIPRNGIKSEQDRNKMDKGIRKTKKKQVRKSDSKTPCFWTLPEKDRRGSSVKLEQLYEGSQLLKAREN